MDVKIFPSKLDGIIEAVSSKAMAHRMFIAAALSDKPTRIYLNTRSGDVERTVNCLKELGAVIRSEDSVYSVSPVWENLNKNAVLDVGGSSAALRLLLPVAAAIGGVTFVGEGDLAKKSLEEYLFTLKGCAFSRDRLPFTLRGKLSAGEYVLRNSNTQFASGLLFALALTDGESTVSFEGVPPSRGYMEMTESVMRDFGIGISFSDKSYKVTGGKFRSPGFCRVEGDYATAAYFLGANAFGNRVRVTGLSENSFQEEKAVKKALLAFNAKGTVLDVSEFPSLTPILAVCACYACSRTVIKNFTEVRLKEGERTQALVGILNKLGGDARLTEEGLVIEGKGGLKGGAIVDSFGDARLAMAAAFAATLADNPVTLLTAQAVKKLYPDFFNDFIKLGGKVSVL